MEYDLVKYKYGTVRKYTAFCVVPHKPGQAFIAGRSITFDNAGKSCDGARHFQTAKTAADYVRKHRLTLRPCDWELLPGTAAYPS